MATEKLQVYKCPLCGNMVEVVHAGGGTLVCCGQPMEVQTENTTDAATEKHVPVIEQGKDGVRVVVGSVAHPMTQDHYIEWIEVTMNGKSYRQFLNPNDPPEAFFPLTGANITARAYCNLHGLWKS
jgi:superoxide reductase